MLGVHKAVYLTLTRVSPECVLASLAASVAPRASVGTLDVGQRNKRPTKTSLTRRGLIP